MLNSLDLQINFYSNPVREVLLSYGQETEASEIIEFAPSHAELDLGLEIRCLTLEPPSPNTIITATKTIRDLSNTNG